MKTTVYAEKRRVERHTGIRRCKNTRAREVTVEIMTTFSLIESIHDKGGVRPHSVGIEASATRLNRATVHSLAAHVVYVGLQCSIRHPWLWHAPLLPVLGRCWSWNRLHIYHHRHDIMELNILRC